MLVEWAGAEDQLLLRDHDLDVLGRRSTRSPAFPRPVRRKRPRRSTSPASWSPARCPGALSRSWPNGQSSTNRSSPRTGNGPGNTNASSRSTRCP